MFWLLRKVINYIGKFASEHKNLTVVLIDVWVGTILLKIYWDTWVSVPIAITAAIVLVAACGEWFKENL